jgi:hypothetical protein
VGEGRWQHALGSAGFSLLVDDAQEVIRLEQERGRVDEKEAMRRHSAAVATLREYAEYRQHDRELGRRRFQPIPVNWVSKAQ